MQLTTLVDRLDDRLRTDAFADIDASANGLQVERVNDAVERVAFAVDAALATIEEAGEWDADVLVTHHGLIWGGLDRVTGRDFHRLNALMEDDIGLYVSHLPLDGQQELGNAAGVADVLGLEDREPFGEMGGEYIGQQGSFSDPVGVEDLASHLDDGLNPAGLGVQVFDFGPDPVEAVGIVTGSGADWVDEAAEKEVDVLVTGEGKQHLYHDACESGVSVVLVGHYATETFGVRALRELAEDWGLETTFIDHPTRL